LRISGRSKAMALTRLSLVDTPGYRHRVLAGMPLAYLDLSGSRVAGTSTF